MIGTARTITPNWRSCMDLCASNAFCQHFGYWPDGGCNQQGSDSMLIKAQCLDGEETCAGLEVISGPRDFSDKALWPAVFNLHMFAGPAALAARPSPPTPSPESAASTGASQGVAGSGKSPFLIAGLFLLLTGVGGFAAYQNGLCGDKGAGDDEYDEEESGEEDMEEKEIAGLVARERLGPQSGPALALRLGRNRMIP